MIRSNLVVASVARPGGNVTGVNFVVAELGSKQLGLLHELVPTATHVGLLVNPNMPLTESVTRDVTAAASAARRAPAHTGDLPIPLFCRRRGAGYIRRRRRRVLSRGRRLHRSYPARRDTGGAPSSGTDQVRVGHQPQNRQDARPHDTLDHANDRRRGHRVTHELCCTCSRPVVALLGHSLMRRKVRSWRKLTLT